jgi:hypothetical protein
VIVVEVEKALAEIAAAGFPVCVELFRKFNPTGSGAIHSTALQGTYIR